MGAPTAVHEAHSTERAGPVEARSLVPWVAVGWARTMGMVLTGTRIGAVPDPHQALWWFTIPSGGAPLASVFFYVSVGLMVVAWLGVGRQALAGGSDRRPRPGPLLGVWGLPLLLGPPLFSRDLYSYVGQGLLVHHGLNPYTVGPSALGHIPLLSAIATVWRDTTSPYGPLFVVSTKAVASVAGGSLVVQVVAFRALELIGVALVMVSLPRLARHLGTDPGVALWLGALSPLALFSFVASGHNDSLMVGLLVAGVTLAVTGRMLPGLLLCALAATIKLPAAAAVAFLAVDGLGPVGGPKRWRVVGEAGGGAGRGVRRGDPGSAATGGPGSARPPSTSPPSCGCCPPRRCPLGSAVYSLLHPLGVPVTRSAVVTVAQDVVASPWSLAVVWLLVTVRRHEVVRSLGLALVLIVVGQSDRVALVPDVGAGAAGRHHRPAVQGAGRGGGAGHAGGRTERPSLLLGHWYVVVSAGHPGAVAWLIRGQHWRAVVTGHAADPTLVTGSSSAGRAGRPSAIGSRGRRLRWGPTPGRPGPIAPSRDRPGRRLVPTRTTIVAAVGPPSGRHGTSSPGSSPWPRWPSPISPPTGASSTRWTGGTAAGSSGPRPTAGRGTSRYLGATWPGTPSPSSRCSP